MSIVSARRRAAAAGLAGLLLMVLRSRTVMGLLLVVHLGTVLALLLTLPYGKFVHGLYRTLALLKSSTG